MLNGLSYVLVLKFQRDTRPENQASLLDQAFVPVVQNSKQLWFSQEVLLRSIFTCCANQRANVFSQEVLLCVEKGKRYH